MCGSALRIGSLKQTYNTIKQARNKSLSNLNRLKQATVILAKVKRGLVMIIPLYVMCTQWNLV